MLISQSAALHFISLYHMLLYYAGTTRDVLPPGMSFDDFLEEATNTKAECRDAIYSPHPLISDFGSNNSDILSEKEQEVLKAWAAHHVKGDFVMLRHLKKHTIFLNTADPGVAYGVLGLTTDLKEIVPNGYLPVYVRTVLLPYEGVIVCDGLVAMHNMLIGPNMSRNMREEYKELEKAGLVLTTLD
jgi:hypothetical protein